MDYRTQPAPDWSIRPYVRHTYHPRQYQANKQGSSKYTRQHHPNIQGRYTRQKKALPKLSNTKKVASSSFNIPKIFEYFVAIIFVIIKFWFYVLKLCTYHTQVINHNCKLNSGSRLHSTLSPLTLSLANLPTPYLTTIPSSSFGKLSISTIITKAK